MAKLSVQDVLRLAELSNISLTVTELNIFSKELTSILEFVEQLQDVDIDGLKPTFQVSGLNSVMRDDELIDYVATRDDLLKNVPARDGDNIKVKKVL